MLTRRRWLTLPSAPGIALSGPSPAAVSIGTNPTFQGRERRVEAYVIEDATGPDGPAPVSLDLYGEHLGIDFTTRLRDTVRFDTVEGLVAQMDEDVRRARARLGVGGG